MAPSCMRDLRIADDEPPGSVLLESLTPRDSPWRLANHTERKRLHATHEQELRAAEWTPPSIGGAAPQPLSMADVGIGIMMDTPLSFLEAAGFNLATQAGSGCQADQMDGLLSSANRTWLMDAASLDVLLLLDCPSYCRNHTTATISTFPGECRLSRTRRPAKKLPREAFDRHHPFDLPRPSWLTTRPNVHLRCYWGAYSSRWSVPRNVRKGAVLQRAMLEVLPRKRFYMKMDLDTLFAPRALLGLLRFVEATVHPESPVYIGNTYLGDDKYTWAFDFDRKRAELLRNVTTGLSGGNGGRVFLRETEAWQILSRLYLTPAQLRASEDVSIRFAAGGMFGLSRAALERLVGSGCMQQLAVLECEVACRRWELQQIEDSVIGLCMHLNRVRLLDSRCFWMSSLGKAPPSFRVMNREACRTIVSIHPLKDASAMMRRWRGLRRQSTCGRV